MFRNMTTTDIIFLLDESGSMINMGTEPVGAINAFIKEQQNVLGNKGTTFSLWKFNTNVTKVYDDIPLLQVGKFSDFNPDSMTSLYDAIGLAITTKLEKDKKDNVIMVILTDGIDNSSQQYKRTKIKDMINRVEKDHSWKIIYMGANQDVFAVGNDLGLNGGSCHQYDGTPRDMRVLTSKISADVADYRVTSSQLETVPFNLLE